MKRIVFWVVICSVALALQACVILYFPALFPVKSELRERVIQKERFSVRDKILLVDVTGMITDTGDAGIVGKENMVARFEEIITRAKGDKRIKAMVLRVNSPGGSVTATDSLYRILSQYKESSGVPVVVSMRDIAASGGYYVSLAADKMYAAPTTITGSIGVVALFPNFKGLTDKLGVEMRVIKSGDKKDIGSVWRDFDPEEEEMLQELIDTLHARFENVVRENRTKVDVNALHEFSDGSVFSAEKALERHLIDGILHLDEVIEEAKKMAGIDGAHVVTYVRAHEYKATVYSNLTMPVPQNVNLINIDVSSFKDVLQPSFYYVWLP